MPISLRPRTLSPDSRPLIASSSGAVHRYKAGNETFTSGAVRTHDAKFPARSTKGRTFNINFYLGQKDAALSTDVGNTFLQFLSETGSRPKSAAQRDVMIAVDRIARTLQASRTNRSQIRKCRKFTTPVYLRRFETFSEPRPDYPAHLEKGNVGGRVMAGIGKGRGGKNGAPGNEQKQ